MSVAYSIVIPAFNEERTIARAIREAHRFFTSFSKPFEIIVVDDGSSDRTAEIVNEMSREIPELRLLRHGENRGKGVAVQTGFAHADGEIILFFDADLSTHPVEFTKFLPALRSADIVIGSRRVRGSRIAIPQSFYRTFGGRIFNFFLRAVTGLPYHDTQCGFKAFRARTKYLFRDLSCTGWMFDVEILLRAHADGYRIAEVPVTWRHGAESRVRLRDAWKIFRDILRITKISK